MSSHRLILSAALSSLLVGAGAARAAEMGVQILSATVKDKVIDGAQVVFQKNGNTSVTASSNAGGTVSVAVPFGGVDDTSVTMIVKKEGYSNLVVKCPCQGLTYALSPTMKSLDGLRVVLDWGRKPADLDSHLVYPGNHVFFTNKTGDGANLDVDDTDGFGPETITLEKRKPGVKYLYAVHNFTDGDRVGSKGISSISRAKVFVYIGSSLVRTFQPPAGKVGNTWVAFGIGDNGEFYDINRFADVKGREKVETALVSIIETAGGLTSAPEITGDGRALAQSLNKQGEQAYHAKLTEESVRLYLDAINNDPEYGQAYSNLGLSYQKLGQRAEALWANRKAIALASGPTADTVRASSYYNIARIYEDAQDWSNALDNYERAKRSKDRPPYTQGIERAKAKLRK